MQGYDTPSAQLRWTINTTGGIRMDSKRKQSKQKILPLCVKPDGKLMAIYLNSVLVIM
ncbi:MAG: hypothetical protein IPL23_26810 [Saprospiraceae bacterium]|nr:hypothetical protein [Saprospiraceae bacterium]